MTFDLRLNTFNGCQTIMAATKEHILSEVLRLSQDLKGKSPSQAVFEDSTRIKESEWKGKYWTKWSDVLREAGLTPNTFGADPYDENQALTQFAKLASHLGKLPTRDEIKLYKNNGWELPSIETLRRNFGNRESLVKAVESHCKSTGTYPEVALLCQKYLKDNLSTSDEVTAKPRIGYVYMQKHGNRPEYKIGKTWHAAMREGQLKLLLPEEIQPIHYIETVDPPGVEAYWHKRFKKQHLNGEWFRLSSAQVKEFKMWRKIC